MRIRDLSRQGCYLFLPDKNGDWQARGFLFTPVAIKLGVPFVMLRKAEYTALADLLELRPPAWWLIARLRAGCSAVRLGKCQTPYPVAPTQRTGCEVSLRSRLQQARSMKGWMRSACRRRGSEGERWNSDNSVCAGCSGEGGQGYPHR